MPKNSGAVIRAGNTNKSTALFDIFEDLNILVVLESMNNESEVNGINFKIGVWIL